MRLGAHGEDTMPDGRPYSWLEVFVAGSPLRRSHEYDGSFIPDVRAATIVVWTDEDPPGIAIAPGAFTFPEVVIDTGYTTHTHEGVEGVPATAGPCMAHLLVVLAENIVDMLHDAYTLALRERCPGIRGHGPMHVNPECFGVICRECGVCPLCPGLQVGHLDGCWRDGEETVRIPRAECCAFHNYNCEPPSELCCPGCIEARHPDHPRGEVCTWKRPVEWFG